MAILSTATALTLAIAGSLSRCSYADTFSIGACADTCSNVAASMAGEGVGLAYISRTCEGICTAVEAQSDTSCGEVLMESSFEHLALLAYSSGHVPESAAILLGAALNSSEAAAFAASLHLNDHGSPAACADIDDAHYCLAQVPLIASIGLCLPTSCDSASVMALVGNLTSILSSSTSSSDGGDSDDSSSSSSSAAAAGLGEASFTCGNELRLGIDAGTVAVLCLIGVLVALATIGTTSDYLRRQSHKDESFDKFLKREAIVTEADRQVSEPAMPVMPHEAGTVPEPQLRPSSSLVEEGESNVEVFYDTGGVQQFSEDSVREPLLQSGPTGEAVEPIILFHRSVRPAGGAGDGGGRPPRENRMGSQRVDGRSTWWIECLECFSLIKNTDKLLAPPRPGDEFPALDGVRSLSMLWVLLGHTLAYNIAAGAGYTNVSDLLPQDGSGFLARLTAQVIPGGFLSVDTFFLMSGFLVSSVLLLKLDKTSPGRYLWIAQAYLHRYLRLTPTLAFVTLMIWKVLPLFGEGPTWWPVMINQQESCSKYWWVEITYLTNLLPWPPLSAGCTGVSWYLSNDTQFFVIAVPLVALFHRRPRVGTAVALLVLTASCLYTLIWIGFHKGVSLSILSASEGWTEAYGEPWARCPPYLIGLLCGFLWHTEVRTRLRGAQEEESIVVEDQATITPTGSRPMDRVLNTKAAVAVAIASVVLLAFPVYGSYWAYQDSLENQMPPWADHIYLAFSRPAWALGVAGMCALCFTGRGSVVNWILTWPAWVTPSRLTYCAYFTHSLLLLWLYSQRLTPVKFTSLEYAVTFMGCAVGSFAGATILHLFVEAPFRNLESWARKQIGGREST